MKLTGETIHQDHVVRAVADAVSLAAGLIQVVDENVFDGVHKTYDHVVAIEHIPDMQGGRRGVAGAPHVDTLVLRPYDPYQARPATDVERGLRIQALLCL